MLFTYPALFHKENDSYWVEFPDLIGCQTYGFSLNETVEYAQEALSSYILTLIDEDKELPKPSDIKDINTLIKDENTFITLIPCDIGQYKNSKSVKKTLTIPAWLNDKALAQGINFSKVLQDALLRKIQSKN
ncbi:MAG: HicB family protein [Clostridiales bacterium]|nr:HicB family protein [Clostridiales bacterium]